MPWAQLREPQPLGSLADVHTGYTNSLWETRDTQEPSVAIRASVNTDPDMQYTGTSRASLSRGGGGGGGGGEGVWTQNLVCQKVPDQIFPVVNFIFSRDGHLVWGGGEGVWGEAP